MTPPKPEPATVARYGIIQITCFVFGLNLVAATAPSLDEVNPLGRAALGTLGIVLVLFALQAREGLRDRIFGPRK